MRCMSLGVLAVSACIHLGTANAIELSVSPPNMPVSVGSVFPVHLVVSGLGNLSAPSLGSYDIDLDFDPDVLNLLNTTFGPQLDVRGMGSIKGAIAGVGTVNLFEVSLDAAEDLNDLQAGEFVLATLDFQASAPGYSALSLSVNAFADEWGDDLSVDIVSGSVTAVPEPSSALLMLLGLLPIALVARRYGGDPIA